MLFQAENKVNIFRGYKLHIYKLFSIIVITLCDTNLW